MNKPIHDRQAVLDLLEALDLHPRALATLLGSDIRTIARWTASGIPRGDTASVIVFDYLTDAVHTKNERILNLARESVRFGGLAYFLRTLTEKLK